MGYKKIEWEDVPEKVCEALEEWEDELAVTQFFWIHGPIHATDDGRRCDTLIIKAEELLWFLETKITAYIVPNGPERFKVAFLCALLKSDGIVAEQPRWWF